ncbi:nuclease-related domain-containing protein [Sporosarcina sp. HYO08]|uniref:nuclease-related domain-containing protein n=1 Tax=Sporosarcina sp. HYO08 TaxID=1759557 RepID=UPI0007980272|nr:nuclease-related domain-containing protein [Sporosarcina sp. HYO08]KXH84016.1 hypothetical protein AU377_04485 [Sporosarcina sp. HYO08]
MTPISIYRRKPEIIKALHRLLIRLHPDSPHFERMKDILYQQEAGYIGEVKVDNILHSIHFPEPVKILTNVELAISPGNFIPIDTLIVSSTSILILEIKNIAGTFTYIPNPPHFVRTYQGKESIVIDCPFMQLRRNQIGLDQWLAKNRLPIKSTGMIVMANHKTSVLNAPPDMPIHYAKHLSVLLRGTEPKKQIMTQSQINELAYKLQQDLRPYNPYPICEKYNIDPRHLKKGFICSNCSTNLIRYSERKWECPTCGELTDQSYLGNGAGILGILMPR